MAEVTDYAFVGGGTQSHPFSVTATMRASTALTASYVASAHVDLISCRKANLLFVYDWDSATSVEWYVEWSNDASTWFRSVNVSAASAINTVAANNQTIVVSADINWADSYDKQARYMRVQVKRTAGSATLELLAIKFSGERY